MKPGAGICKGRIPALQHIVWVLPCQPLLVQYVTFKSQKHVSEKTTWKWRPLNDQEFGMWYTVSAAACKYCKRKKAGEYCCCHKLGPHCSNLKSWAHWNGRMGLGRLLYKVVWNKQRDGCWIFVGMIRLVFVLHWPDGWYCILLKYDGQMFYPKISGQSQLLRFQVLD